MVSGGPDVAAVEVDYLSGFDLPLRLKTARREAPEDQCFFFTLEDPTMASPYMPPPSAWLPASGAMTRTESCSTSLPIPPAGWNTRSSTPI